MIPIEQQVTSLESSMQLKQLGMHQGESYFVWAKCLRGKYSNMVSREHLEDRNTGLYRQRYPNESKLKIICDAFTVSELLNLLREDNIGPTDFFILNKREVSDVTPTFLADFIFNQLNADKIKEMKL